MYSRLLLVAATALTLTSTVQGISFQHQENENCSSELYPQISDNTHASHPLIHIANSFFTAKSAHNLTAWISHFSPTNAISGDATLGETVSQPNLTSTFASIVAGWDAAAKSYPLRLIGDLNSAVIFSVDTPSLFGAELRIISAYDFADGKVARQVDYWDARGTVLVADIVPADDYPSDFGENKHYDVSGLCD